MNDDSKEKNLTTAWQNNDDQRNDSIFQEEGDYIINEMPKYKYEIKVIHESPNRNRIKKVKTPDRISSIRFTIVNKPKLNNVKKQNNIYINKYNNENFIKKLNMDIRTEPTIRFYSGNSYIQKDIRNNTYQKAFKYKKKHKRYNNKNINKHYNYIDFYDLNKYDSNCDYIIEIFPTNSCICQKEINKIINEYFQNCKYHRYYYNNCNLENEYENRQHLNNKKNINIYDKNFEKKENDYFYNIYFPPRKKSFKEPIQIEKPINNIYYPKRVNTPCNCNSSNKINLNRTINTKKIIKDNYNNNIYLETSNISSPKKSKQLKKIKISKKSASNMPCNNSFISADNTRNLSPYNNSFINHRKYNRKNYLSPYNIKSQSLSNNLNNTTSSKGRKSNNIMINKSSERHERIKVVPICQKINPLIVKKSVKKPIKEKIVNKDGTTTNVIRQTSVLTSIESKPFIDKEKNENLIKENITKIYTTLTKIENDQDNINGNNTKDMIDNNVNLNINNEIEKDQKKNDKENNNIEVNDENNNIFNIPKSENKNIINNNDLLEINNDLLIHKNNNNSSFNYSSLYSNVYDLSEQSNNNNGRINEIIKYLKYLYYRCTNLTSLEEAKEESLSNYFLKLNNDEKMGVLHYLNDGNAENKKIHTKLKNILEGNNNGLIIDNEKEKNIKKNSFEYNFEKK